ncbi:hypothetical protein ACFPYI_04300 [Halomarina salina]|uniref:Lipoprotein n=1 Tax=Halomarina salina TaxID=1872699 RepID=A0ABD5RJF2_9EURY|nr:hypothetical protein [Halomarina salina]
MKRRALLAVGCSAALALSGCIGNTNNPGGQTSTAAVESPSTENRTVTQFYRTAIYSKNYTNEAVEATVRLEGPQETLVHETLSLESGEDVRFNVELRHRVKYYVIVEVDSNPTQQPVTPDGGFGGIEVFFEDDGVAVGSVWK